MTEKYLYGWRFQVALLLVLFAVVWFEYGLKLAFLGTLSILLIKSILSFLLELFRIITRNTNSWTETIVWGSLSLAGSLILFYFDFGVTVAIASIISVILFVGYRLVAFCRKTHS